MPHLDEGQLTALLDGEMAAADRVEAESHLATCAECRQLLDDTRMFFQQAGALVESVQLPAAVPNRPLAPVLGGAPAMVPDRRSGEPPGRRGNGITAWRSLGWAASIILAVGLGWFASDLRYRAPTAAPISDMKSDSADQAEMAAKSAEPTVNVPGETTHPTPQAGAMSADKPAQSRPGEAEARLAAPPASPAAPVPDAGLGSNSAAVKDEGAKLAESVVKRQEAAERVAVGRTESPASRPAPAAFAAQAPSAAGAAQADARRERANVRTVTLEEAVRSLGGTIRLVDGMVPARVEVMESVGPDNNRIRVVYLDPPGRELWLDQERRRVTGGALARELDDQSGLLAGDTLVVAGPGGRQSLSWMDQTGLRLGLTGFLPADSLRGLARRIR